MIRVKGVGERLRAERERLGLSQTQMADLGGVVRTTAFRYESGAHSPSLEFLEALEGAGADVTYVLTGLTPEARADMLADAIEFVDELLVKHDLQVPSPIRARLISRVLEARQGGAASHRLDLGTLLFAP